MTGGMVGGALVWGSTVLEMRHGSATFWAGRLTGLSEAWFLYL